MSHLSLRAIRSLSPFLQSYRNQRKTSATKKSHNLQFPKNFLQFCWQEIALICNAWFSDTQNIFLVSSYICPHPIVLFTCYLLCQGGQTLKQMNKQCICLFVMLFFFIYLTIHHVLISVQIVSRRKS